MNVREEINAHAIEQNKPILTWLFDRYHMQSEWFFVAHCARKKEPRAKYGSVRVWSPSEAGQRLYDYEHKTRTVETQYYPGVKVEYFGPGNRLGSRVKLSIPNHDGPARKPVFFGYDHAVSGIDKMAINWLSAAGFVVVATTADKDSYTILVNWSGTEVDALWDNLKKAARS